ncbi:hypothetical protein K432DRAFT_291991 [Lepidopterella palustris CBS 459.81]|uniref:Nuclear segregation protein n=1 Tax=Lepidopterella palustris CBS 459.81 TaxID=1314670 RepID=A0A8E2EGA9_9PEZI|nr:hypothetical protein K432DRAFT_291991 [Lepidopterella palustris CBS 459.81]
MASSDATASTASASKTKTQFVKPEKPDEEKYKKELEKAEKDHAASQEKFNAVKAKFDLARPNNKDSPNAKRQQELKTELNAIRQQQQGHKSSRNAVHERIKKIDEQLKSRMNELKAARARVNYRSAEDVDQEIQRLQKQVDTGAMKLVDEKKALTEISNLNKLRKNFAGFDAQQKSIDDLKAQIAEQKKLLDDPEQKALSEKYTELQTELDELKAEQDDAFKSMKALRDQTDKARAEQQEKYVAMKQIKDAYFQQKRAFMDYEREAYRVRQERKRQERHEWEASKRREVARQKLEEASAPAYQDEILTAEGLIRYFDPSALAAKETVGPSKFAAAPQRKVDDSGIKGTRFSKKDTEEESYFMGTGGKKGKKGRKAANASSALTPSEGKFNLSIGVIEELSKVGVDSPSSQGDVPSVVEKLKEKLEHWKKDQDRKTKENIAKAQKEIERLETDSHAAEHGSKDTARKPAKKNQATNGDAVSASAELAQEKDAEEDVAEDLKNASLEDAEDEKAEA